MSTVIQRFGIGAAEVDLKLPSTKVYPGEVVEATIEVNGGSAKQEIEGFDIEMRVQVDYEHENKLRHEPIADMYVGGQLAIYPGKQKTKTVEIQIPYGTPLASESTEVWFDTSLDIDWALDPSDRDVLEVVPSPRQEVLFEAFEILDYEHVGSASRLTTSNGFDWGCIQRLDFRPPSDEDVPFDTLGVIWRMTDERVDLIFKPDGERFLWSLIKGFQGEVTLQEFKGVDESLETLTYDDDDPEKLAAELAVLIERRL
jgi:sporulation-control protein